MRTNSIRFPLEFTGDGAHMNSMQTQWASSLLPSPEDPCISTGTIIAKLMLAENCQHTSCSTESRVDWVGSFADKQSLEAFARTLFFFLNNDGAAFELDFEDLDTYFSFCNARPSPIRLLSRGDLHTVHRGGLLCFILVPDIEGCLKKNILPITQEIESEAGEDVICLISAMIIPNIKTKEIIYFHKE